MKCHLTACASAAGRAAAAAGQVDQRLAAAAVARTPRQQQALVRLQTGELDSALTGSSYPPNSPPSGTTLCNQLDEHRRYAYGQRCSFVGV
jgi:hypothetical protein